MSDKCDIAWEGPFEYGIIHVQHAIGSHVQTFGEPGEDGNWLVSKHVNANKRHDFVFEFNGEYFELTGVEMLEALRAFQAMRVVRECRG